MIEFGRTVIAILALVGLSLIAGILTRNTERGKDKDDIVLTLLRGLVTIAAVGMIISVIIVAIYLLYLLFTAIF